MSEPQITSSANPRLKRLVALRRRRVREQEGVMLVEGLDELMLALDAGVRPEQLFLCPELMRDPPQATTLADRAGAAGAHVFHVGRAAFERVAYREGPDGVLALVPRVDRSLQEIRLPAEPLLLLAEGVEKPGNLGAMLRTADAVGVDAVIAVDPVTDWGNPNVVRASKGTVFAVPVAAARSDEVLAWLSDAGVRLLAATPDTDVEHTAVDLTGPVAVAVGAERDGLTERLMAAAEVQVRIPMYGQVNSLNVATSAAVLLYEARRQRA